MNDLTNALNQVKMHEVNVPADLRERRIIRNNNHNDYVYDNLTAYVDVCGKTLLVQNGLSYYQNNYSLPSNKLKVSSDGGCDDVFVAMSNLSESELEAFDADEIADFNDTHDTSFESSSEMVECYLAMLNAIVTIEQAACVDDDITEEDLANEASE